MKYCLCKNIDFICIGKNALLLSGYDWSFITYEYKRHNILNENNVYFFNTKITSKLSYWQYPCNHGKIFNEEIIENHYYRQKLDLLEKLENNLTTKTTEKRSKI